jgi:hypothetical protein
MTLPTTTDSLLALAARDTLAAPPGIAFVVTLEDGIMFITQPAIAGGDKHPLLLQTGTTFAPGGTEAPVTMTFVPDASGQVAELIVRQGGNERKMRKVR